MPFLQRLLKEGRRASSLNEGPTPRPVWLTFDDGPSREITPDILKTLRRYRVKATFFVVGAMVADSGQLLRKIVAAGHRVGNHTYSHPDLRLLTDREIVDEVRRTEREIARHTVPDMIFRPPFGLHDERVDRIIAEAGYRMILWDIEPRDWDPQFREGKWVDTGIDLVRQAPSCRVLLHDIHPTTAGNLGRFISGLRSIGNVVLERPSTLQ